MMKDGLNFVPLRIQKERCVVFSMIVSKTRRSFACSARGDSRDMKGVDLGRRSRSKTPMPTLIRRGLRRFEDAQVRVYIIVRSIPFTEPDSVGPIVGDARAESRHDRHVERLHSGQMPYGDRDVVEQLHLAD
jgi:hypothetical protein